MAFDSGSLPIDTWLAAMQDDLLMLNSKPDLHSGAQRLISALKHYQAVAESARGFVRSVVEPPLPLVFRDTVRLSPISTRIRSEREEDLTKTARRDRMAGRAVYGSPIG